MQFLSLGRNVGYMHAMVIFKVKYFQHDLYGFFLSFSSRKCGLYLTSAVHNFLETEKSKFLPNLPNIGSKVYLLPYMPCNSAHMLSLKNFGPRDN